MRAGLLLVDLQQDFLAHPGLFPGRDALVAHIARLLAAFRAGGLPVVHVHTLVRTDTDQRMPHWKRQDKWSCVAGTAGASPPDALKGMPGEPVLTKSFFSAFQNDGLDAFLRPRVDVLVVAGVHTHACVRSTVLDAYQRGYEVWVAADGIASYDALHAAVTQDYLEGRACRFMETPQIIQRLGLVTPGDTSEETGSAPLYAGGRWLPSATARTWHHHNPSAWTERLYSVAIGDRYDTDHAVRRAASRQPAWSGEAAERRAALLLAWAETLQSRRAEVVATLVREIGKPLIDAEAEFDYALQLIRAAAARTSLSREAPLANGVDVVHHPLGVVGLITPWNNALAIPVGKIAPALAHGNTVCWKPALQGRGVVVHVLETLAEAGFPDDSVNVILGDAATGLELVTHPGVAAVSFTGSVAAGRAVAALCAGRGKPLQAELGGNNGVVIGDCADLAQAAADIALAAFSFSGQRCTAPRRVIVLDQHHDAFLDPFLDRVGALRLGHPADPATRVGPLISKAHRERIMAHIDGALAQGGRLLRGGRVPDHLQHGCWIEPAVVAPASEQDTIVREESFGPLVVVQRARDFEAAVACCNGVEHGLVATLYSEDEDQQRHFCARAQAAILRIGDARLAIHPQAPFGGWKASGIGPPEHGRWDGTFYSRPQAVYRRPRAVTFPVHDESTAWKN